MALTVKEELEAVNHQIKELVGIYRTAVSGPGISENEFWVWYALIILGGEYSQQDICGLWSLSKQTVNTIIIGLVRRGLLTLENVPGSRNRKLVRLTDAGRVYGEALVRPVFRAEERAWGRMLPEERKALMGLLAKYSLVIREELAEGREDEL